MARRVATALRHAILCERRTDRFTLSSEWLTGARLAAPSPLDFELANVCLSKIKRQPSRREALRSV
jgi:hypothetical protein